LLAEVMNIRLVGPNLPLAPSTDPGDGWFDLVLVYEHQRRALLQYLEQLEETGDTHFPFDSLPCRIVTFERIVPALHIDDIIIDLPKDPIRVSIKPCSLKYMRMRN
jgi:hypothetical protein